VVARTFRSLRSLFEPARDPVLGLFLSGGGARAAYQAGVLQFIAEAFPEAWFRQLTGVSAGAINAGHLAIHPAGFPEAAGHLVDSWHKLRTHDVFEPESHLGLLWSFLRGAARGEENELPADMGKALVDTSPLRGFLAKKMFADENGRLTGIGDNIARGRIETFAVVTTNYSNGQTVVFIEGKDVEHWERPGRRSISTQMTVEHIMASTALPLIFPAVRIGDDWYGDGGVRLTAPLSPVIHMGADRILVVSTRYRKSRQEADQRSVTGYPPPAQIIGLLLSAVFLDVLDQDALMVGRINRLVRHVPDGRRGGMRKVNLLLLRPSVDLARLSQQFEMDMPGPFRFLTRGLGTGATRSPDWLSMLLFEKDYIERLIEIGYEDARRQKIVLETFISGEPLGEDGALEGTDEPGVVRILGS
jgi:NTE family protein